jgi:hypothetical protein
MPTDEGASERAVYVSDATALMANPSERARLASAISAGEITEVVPYGLGGSLSSSAGRQELVGWFDELHAAGARIVAPVSSTERVLALEGLGTRLDGMVTELEFWNRDDRAAAFEEERQLLGQMRAAGATWTTPDHVVEVGAYLGYPTADEAQVLADAVDFVFLNYSVSSPTDAYDHTVGMRSLRERFTWFAAAGTPIWPIFYATGEVDMRAALASAGTTAAEQVFCADVARDGVDAPLAGFTYFAFEALPEHW